MSRTTACINRINKELDKISGLDDIVANKLEDLEKDVKKIVSDILDNTSEVDIIENVTPFESFDLELKDGYTATFSEGVYYKVFIENNVFFVVDKLGVKVPFDSDDFKESFMPV